MKYFVNDQRIAYLMLIKVRFTAVYSDPSLTFLLEAVHLFEQI